MLLTAIGLFIISLAAFATIAYGASKKHVVTQRQQSTMSTAKVIKTLKAGNARYVSGRTIKYKAHRLARHASKHGQHPYAFILSCIDSRSVPELVFNQPPGALFVSRTAGNVISSNILGGMEFATTHAGTKLIVVMGHTHCGAVAGACKKVNKPAQLHQLLQQIQPAVDDIQHHSKHAINCEKPQVIDEIAKQNVINQIHRLFAQSTSLKHMADEQKIRVIGAMHNIHSGKVSFFDANGHAL